jgi:Flp pilus assembly protein TadD
MSEIGSQRESLQALLRDGFRSLANGQIAAAAECCKKALKIDPDLVQGHFLVGLVALQAKDRKTAFKAFNSVTQLQPDHAAAWAQLAKLFMTEGQVFRADAALQKATSANSSDPIVQDLMGSVYSLMGEYSLAKDCFMQATAGQPNHPPYMLNLASNLVYHGDTSAAVALHREIIKIQPNSPQAHWSLSSARKATDREHIHQLRSLLADHEHDLRAQAFYYYAIGKELEDLQEWDQAFEAFSSGARARRQTVEFDEAAECEMFQYCEETFTSQWLQSDSEGFDTEAPIFVLGQPRTGTTLVERIIGSHSTVHAAGELQQFGLAIRRLSQHTEPKRFSRQLFEAAARLDSHKIGAMYFETTRRMHGEKPRFIDKLPQNYLFVPLILKALPNAKIIHVTRSAPDACFASFKQLFADAYLHSYDLEEMARHHCRYRHMMATWREAFPGAFLDISYENTVRDLEPNVRTLLEFLGLPWEDGCLRFHEQASAVSTASAVQVREPAHTRSIDRWRRYETQLEPMLAILRQHDYA